MEIIYQSNDLTISSYDFENTEICDTMADFFIHYQGTEYSCSAVSIDYVNLCIQNKALYFWCISSIIVKKCTKDNIIQAVLDIVNDKSMLLDDVFIKSQ